MLSPKWLARCTAPIAELYAQAESSILDDMARRISTYDFYIPAAQYQEEKLAMMGMTRQEIIAELSKRTGKTRQEIQAVMKAGAAETCNSDGVIYAQAGKEVPEKISSQMRKIIRSGLKQTAGLFDNLTKTTAQAATRQFEKALDLAWLQVSTGAMDPRSATRQAIKSLCKVGIQAIAYPTGHSDTLEVAVTRALRTGVNQTALKMQEQLADEMGSDLVEVTAHAGARPDHAKWQGKVYSLTGRTPGYQTLAKATGYGTGAGLGGWNCRHSFFPRFPGQSNTYSKDELEEYTRPDAVEYNGKKMSLYEAEQTQRSIERNIRRWKREDNALQAAGLDTTESSAKVKLWNSRYKDFCAKTGLKQQRQRTVAYTHIAEKNVASAKGNGIINIERPIATRKMANGLRTPASYVLSEDDVKSISKDAESIQIPEKVLDFNKGGRTGFSDEDVKIHVRGDILPDLSSDNPRDRMTPRAVLAHEYYGHYKAHPSNFRVGDWRDEFRASYRAALDAPGLDDDERRSLMIDAYERAKEANVPVKYNKAARRIIYGYE